MPLWRDVVAAEEAVAAAAEREEVVHVAGGERALCADAGQGLGHGGRERVVVEVEAQVWQGGPQEADSAWVPRAVTPPCPLSLPPSTHRLAMNIIVRLPHPRRVTDNLHESLALLSHRKRSSDGR